MKVTSLPPATIFQLFLAAMLLTALGGASNAATLITEPKEPTCDFMLSGAIEQGDAARLERAISPSVDGRVLCLDSPGGDLREGIALFHVIWEKDSVVTRVKSNDTCTSACAIAFLGGSRTVGTGVVRSRQSVVEPGSVLGFHSPRIQISENEVYSSNAVQAGYAQALESMGKLLDITFIEEHGVRGMATYLLKAILRTPPTEMFYVNTVGRASLAEIGIADTTLPEITWLGIKNACDTAIIKSRKDLVSLGVQRAFALFGADGVDGKGELIAFADRSWSWQDGPFMHFVIRGYPAPHNNERFCKISISRVGWEYAKNNPPDPRLPNAFEIGATLWTDFDVPTDDGFSRYAQNVEIVHERVNLSWYSLYDPKMLTSDLRRR